MNGAAITIIDGKYATPDNRKQFSTVPFHIPWYGSDESNKVFSLFLNEIGEINASGPLLKGLIQKNPFFDHADITYLIASKGSMPTGRIAAIVDTRYNEENGQNAGWIGMPEFIENAYTAEQLIETAVSILANKGCEKVIGPAKFNANGEVGLLIDGFDKKPYFMEGYNAPYYQEYLERIGFTKENDWYSIQVEDTNSSKITEYMSRIERWREAANKSTSERSRLAREVRIRPISFADFDGEVKVLEELYNGEWGKGNHPQFVTMTHDEMVSLASGIKLIALEELVLVAELGGRPIGISATVPNLNEVIAEYDRRRPDYLPSDYFLNLAHPKSILDLKRDLTILAKTRQKLKHKSFDSLRVLILGVKEEYRRSGIDGLLYHETFRRANEMGIKSASFSELADINHDILMPLEAMGERAMTWRVYSREI